MTVEMLLMPRYEVMVDYPFSPYRVGRTIILPDTLDERTSLLWVQSKEEYPNIFRRMNWNEKIKEDQVTGYYKWGDIVFKGRFNGHSVYYTGMGWINIVSNEIIPATEQDYTSYQQSKH